MAWSTTLEKNSQSFVVERSIGNSTSFSTVGTLPAAGNSAGIQNYTFTDPSPAAGTNYYRLKQIDFNGEATYSPITVTDCGTTSAAVLNASIDAQNTLHVTFNSEGQEQDLSIDLFDMSGRLLHTFHTTVADNDIHTYDINTSLNLSAGMYCIGITGSHFRKCSKIIKL